MPSPVSPLVTKRAASLKPTDFTTANPEDPDRQANPSDLPTPQPPDLPPAISAPSVLADLPPDLQIPDLPPFDPTAAIPDPNPPVHQPAASETDSPSRGIPKPTVLGKEITGGWGQESAQYFALDGAEIQTLAASLFQELTDRMAANLRFGMACCYPQVRVRVVVQVDGSSEATPIHDARFDLPAARLLTLTATVQDNPETPADALRNQHGLPKPRKQVTQTGGGRFLVNRMD